MKGVLSSIDEYMFVQCLLLAAQALSQFSQSEALLWLWMGSMHALVVAGLLFYIDVVDVHNIYRILGYILSDIPKVAHQVFQNNNKLYPFDTLPNNSA